MRIILYTGKGGVGKTSIAAATACKLAQEGKKVLIMSTDQAHSLGDSLDVKLSPQPVQVTEFLSALEIDTVNESEGAWGKLHGYLKQLLTSHAQNGLEAEELLTFPGLEELFSLFKILDIYEENIYDVLIVDCAPTGETLSLLKFPEQFGNLLETFLPMKRVAVKAVGPAVEKITKIPMPKDDVFDDLLRLTKKLEHMQRLMSDKETVSLRIVTTPEKIVIQEAKHNYTCLHLYDYNVDAILVNKIYPNRALEGYFNKWIALQEESLMDIRESFSNLPVFTLELMDKELRGISMLLQAAGQLYGEENPIKVFTKETFMRVRKEEQGYILELILPFAKKEELDLGQKDGELLLSVRNEKRRFLLPDNLKGKQITKAKYDNGSLLISFE